MSNFKTKLCLYLSVYVLLLIFSIDADGSVSDNSLIVNTESGAIQGSVLKTLLDKRSFYSFKGIPYAQPPLGALRFKAPQKVKPWEETLDATAFREMCAQISLFNNKYEGVEDCLFLNVFTPSE